MSLGSPENRESGESHPLYAPLRQRCLVLVDENGNALDGDKQMRMEGPPDLAVVHAVGEGAEDPYVGYENCRQFMEWATELLTLRDEKRRFSYAEPSLFAVDASVNSLVIDVLDKIHVDKLVLAHESSYKLKERVGLAFARLQMPQVEDRKYGECERFCAKGKLPQQGTSARTILDRVTLTRNLDLASFGDRNADNVLYTGGDYPVPYAYSNMEVLAGGSGIEITRPHQLVYGLQTGALIRATSEKREERFADLECCLRNFGNLGVSVGRPSVYQDVFYFKSRT